MAGVEELEPEFYENMLLKLEAHDVIKWAVGSKKCLEMVKSSFKRSREFRLLFNTHQGRRREDESSWTFWHHQEAENDSFGNVYARKIGDNVVRRSTGVNHLARHLSFVEGCVVTFVHSHGSYLVFTREIVGQPLVLIVVNFVSRLVNVIQCPSTLTAASFKDRPESVRMFVDVGYDKRRRIRRMRFRLLHVFLVEVLGEMLPCVYFYELGRGWVLNHELAVYTPVDPFIARTEFFITFHFQETLGLISVVAERPYFSVVDVENVLTGGVPSAFAGRSVNIFVTPPRFEFKMERIFSSFGVNGSWLAAIFTHTNDFVGVKIIKMISLFKFDSNDIEDGRPLQYRFVSTIPVQNLNIDEVIQLHRCCYDATHNHVQIALMISSTHDNQWRTRYLTYHIASSQWTTLDIPTFSGASLTRLTSRITL